MKLVDGDVEPETLVDHVCHGLRHGCRRAGRRHDDVPALHVGRDVLEARRPERLPEDLHRDAVARDEGHATQKDDQAGHDPIAGGIVGNATDNHGVPYALTREFTSVYRLHSLLPDEIGVYRIARGEQRQQAYGLAELRQAASPQLTRSIPMADWFYSFGVQHPGQLVLNNYPDTLQNLSIPGFGFYDLGAVDVLRDREAVDLRLVLDGDDRPPVGVAEPGRRRVAVDRDHEEAATAGRFEEAELPRPCP